LDHKNIVTTDRYSQLGDGMRLYLVPLAKASPVDDILFGVQTKMFVTQFADEVPGGNGRL
jgi:hypothetical protein